MKAWSCLALIFSDCSSSHGRRDSGLLVRNPFPDEWRVAENAPEELRRKDTMEGGHPAERMAQKQDPVGQCLLVVQFEGGSPGCGYKPGWPYLARLVETFQSAISMDRSKLELAFWLQVQKKHGLFFEIAGSFMLETYGATAGIEHMQGPCLGQNHVWSCLTFQEPMVPAGQPSETELLLDPWQHFLFTR